MHIAGRLASRLQGPTVTTIFLDWLVSSIQAMPATAREAALAEFEGIEAVTAQPLAPSEQAHASSAIAAAFGAPPPPATAQLTFRTDPALVAGLELHGPHFALSNSWRADLDEILNSLRHAPGR